MIVARYYFTCYDTINNAKTRKESVAFISHFEFLAVTLRKGGGI